MGTEFQPAATRRFNHICGLAAAAWLAIIIPASLIIRPTYQDFSAFYMGGYLALHGQWELLYPIPDPASPYYVSVDGAIKPEQRRLADRLHVIELNHYLQPPWTALVLAPLGMMPFETAHLVWCGVLACAVWIAAWSAGRTFEYCLRQPSRVSGLMQLFIVCSPLAYRSIRVGNVSPIVSACVAAVVVSMLSQSKSRLGLHATNALGALAMWYGGILKYASIALLPVILAARRWRILGWIAGLWTLTLIATVLVAGSGVFEEFIRAVGLTMQGSTTNPGNQSIYGMLLRLHGGGPLPNYIITGIESSQFAVLVLLFWLTARCPGKNWVDPPVLCACVTSWLGWLVIFSPLFWEHYHLYFVPMWGWMIWEGLRHRAQLIVTLVALGMAAVPLPVVRWIHFPEPFNSYLLLSAVYMFGLAVWRLARPNGNLPL